MFSQPLRNNNEQLMDVMVRLQAIHGRGVVRFSSEPAVAFWHIKKQLLSPNYTTRWTDVMSVNA